MASLLRRIVPLRLVSSAWQNHVSCNFYATEASSLSSFGHRRARAGVTTDASQADIGGIEGPSRGQELQQDELPVPKDEDLIPFSDADALKVQSFTCLNEQDIVALENHVKQRRMQGYGLATEVRLIKVRPVKNQTGNGKVSSFSVMVVAGNKRGGVGYAIAKDKTVLDAIMKATKLAERNMEFFERYEGRTIYHDVSSKFKASKVFVRGLPSDKGLRCHWAIQEVCRCIGIKDLSAKVYGSRHCINVVQGFFEALRSIKTPKQIAQDTGMKVVDVLKVFKYGSDYFEPSSPKRPFKNRLLTNDF